MYRIARCFRNAQNAMAYIQGKWTSYPSGKRILSLSGCDGCILIFEYSIQSLKYISSSFHFLLWTFRIFLFLFEPIFFVKWWPYPLCDCIHCNASQSSHLELLYLWFSLQSIPRKLHAYNWGTCIWLYLDVGSSQFYIIG